MKWTTKIKNTVNASFGRNIHNLRKLINEEKYSVSVPVSSAAHKDSMRISRNDGTHVILKLKNGFWFHEASGRTYSNVKEVANNIDDIFKSE